MAKRCLLDQWADRYNIAAIGLQEAKISFNPAFESDNYVWFFSSNVKIEHRSMVEKMREEGKPIDASSRLAAQEHLGVGVMIHKSLKECIQNVIAVSNRLIILHLAAKTNMYFYIAYAPTADKEDVAKDEFYDMLENKWRDVANDSYKVVLGDFNAKIVKIDEEEGVSEVVGKFYFEGSQHAWTSLGNSTFDNRRRFLDFCLRNELWIANTHFQKPLDQIITHRPPGTKRGLDPLQYGFYFQVDYILVHRRWKNSCHDAASDMIAPLGSDHYPVWCTHRIKYKVSNNTATRRSWDLKASSEQIKQFNIKFNETLDFTPVGDKQEHDKLDEAFEAAATFALQPKTRKIKKPWITQSTFDLITQNTRFGTSWE